MVPAMNATSLVNIQSNVRFFTFLAFSRELSLTNLTEVAIKPMSAMVTKGMNHIETVPKNIGRTLRNTAAKTKIEDTLEAILGP